MIDTNIGFIGGGNMARSLIGGLVADGVAPQRLWVAEPDAGRRAGLAAQFGVKVTADNNALATAVDALVLAVKPQQMQAVCGGIAAVVQQRKPLVISIAAGLRLEALQRWLGGELALVRTMPNTPALVQSGATALFATPQVNNVQRELAEGIMRAVGLTLWLEDEGQMDAVTALSGSGPAYFFLVMEAMQQAGVQLGLTADMARLLTLQTAFGAAKMALESREDAAVLRRQVTSPGGTTERAIGILQQGGLEELFARALAGARDRSQELATLLGGGQ
ncbi:pyrroline-5-carboxylate reductase [Sulfurivermis fontis]|uniref:pyrroline-5-carboxylate reductase n=1 Tax=Sulfurivermis fontis TaxID=1972068 RepID=UPI000FDBFFAC|nr:pyrroline-5-carboxylate reductase [Sulfurivermis fontis]